MRLTSRERVLSVFDHEVPDRVPCWCGASPEFWARARAELALGDEELSQFLGDDFRRVKARYAGPETPLTRPGATYRSVFGIERRGIGYGQPFEHPLQNATLEDVHAYRWPDPESNDVSQLRGEAAKWGGQYAILGGDWSPFWHDAIDLLGMEGLMVRALEEPEVVDAVFEHVVDYYVLSSERVFTAAGGAIDIFFFGNDFGAQHGPFMGLPLYERFIAPHLKRLAGLGHDFGLKVMMHCCGGVAELIPMFIDCGLDGLHAVQPSCRGMDLRRIKTEFGDRIVLNGAIDSHHVLLKGTPESVRHSTREILDIMMPEGGYIAGASHDTILEETPVDNVVAMFDTIREFGVYPRRRVPEGV